MARTFLCGDFQPTLELALAQFVAHAKSRDPLALVRVVVPSHLLGIHLRRTLGRHAPHLGVQFETLDEVALRVTYAQRAQQGLRLLPRLAFERLIATIVAAAEAGSYFGPVRSMPGFAPRLAATIRDVRDAGIAADDLERVLDSAKARDFAANLRTYEARREQARFLDSAALFALAERCVSAAGDSALGLTPGQATPESLVVYGFYDFTGAQWRLIERLIARDDVLVLAPILEGPAGRFGAPLLARLRALGLENAPAPQRASSDDDRTRLHSTLFAARNGRCRGDGSVRFLAPRFRGEEPREVLRFIDDRLGEGTDLARIGVLYRRREHALSIEREVRVLERSFADLEVPVFVQGGIPALSQRSPKALLELVGAIASGYARRTTFALFDALAVPRVHSLERLAREAGILGRKGIEEWRVRLRAVEAIHAERHPVEDEASAESSLADRRALAREIDALAELDGRLARATRWHDAVSQLVGFVSERFPEQSSGVFEEVSAAFTSLDDLELPYDRAALHTTLEEALRAQAEPTGGFERGLFLGGILGARGLSFDCVILPALEDGVFPRPARQDPILLEGERTALHRALLAKDAPGLALASRAADEERLLFALACRAATKCIVLSCPRREDASEKSVVPSSAWREAIESMLGEPYAGARPWNEPALAPLFVEEQREPLDAREFDRAAVARAIRDGDAARARFVADLDPSVLASLRATRQRGLAKEFTEYDAVLPAALAKRLLGNRFDEPISATRLEDYAKCPFTYFASELLGIDPADPREEDELDFRFRGRILHLALQRFLGEVVAGARPWPPLPEEFDRELARLVTIGREELGTTARSIGLLPILAAAEALKLEDDLRAFVEYECGDDSSFRPLRLEASFGFGKVLGLELVVESRRIAFKGMIDRIDFDERTRRARVIDYKSGPPQTAPHGLEGGRRLQLPIYAFAARGLLPKGTTIAESIYYYFTRRGGGRRAGFAADALGDEARAKLAETVGILATHIERGVFFADPSEPNLCAYCEHSLACGLGAGLEGRFERKRDDAAVATLMQLRAGESEDAAAAEEEA